MSAVLQKKLEELESELDDLFRVPLKYPAFEISFDDILKRFGFLEHLHAMESKHYQPENADHQMLEIGEKINSLKTAFAEWDATRKRFRSSSGNNLDASDSRSICSDCTQTLLNEFQDGDEEDDTNPHSIERFPSEKFVDCEEKEEKDFAVIKNLKEEISAPKVRMGKYAGAFGCGVIVGAAFVVNLFGSNGGFGLYDEAFLVPPT